MDTDTTSAETTEHTWDDRDRAVLEMAGRRYLYRGAREAAIRDELGMTATRYAQVLAWVLDQPEAMAEQPALVGRLRRVREARSVVREARRLGWARGTSASSRV